MCCRIKTSGPAARTIVGLYILLATFLIGYFAVRAVSELVTRPNVDSVTTDKSNFVVEASEDDSGCQNEDNILITKWHDFETLHDHLKVLIGVINRNSVPITYARADITPYSGLGGYNEWNLPSPPINQPTKVLLPQQQYIVNTKSKDGKSSFKITFWYQINNEKTWHFMKAYFPDGNPKPISCRTLTWRP